MLTYPLGLFPKARMNCRRTKAKYTYLRMVLTIGVTLSPNGHPTFMVLGSLLTSGLPVPTRSMMTLVVSQNAAIIYVSFGMSTEYNYVTHQGRTMQGRPRRCCRAFEYGRKSCARCCGCFCTSFQSASTNRYWLQKSR